MKANNARTGDPEVSADVGLDGLDYANYVPLENQRLIAGGTGAAGGVFTFTDGMITGEINLTALELYANALLSNPQVATVAEDDPDTADVDETGVTTTVNSNFDAAGRLIVPMSLQDTDMDGETAMVLAPIKEDQVAERMVSDIRTGTRSDQSCRGGIDGAQGR